MVASTRARTSGLRNSAAARSTSCPRTRRRERALDDIFDRLTGGAEPKPVRLMVHGHPVDVPAQAMGVARLSYADALPAPARRLRLHRARAHLPYHPAGGRAGDPRRPPRRGEALHHAGRRLLRAARQAHRLRRRRAARTSTAPRPATRRSSSPAPCRGSIEMRSREYLALPRGRGQQVTGNTTGLVET